MQWETPTYLWLLVLVPVMLLLFGLSQSYRRKLLGKLGDAALIRQVLPSYSPGKRWLKTVLFIAAIAVLVVSLANLRVGSKRKQVQGSSSEVIICFDVSASMQARDVKPDRFTRARLQAASLIEALSGNKIGLVVFAGNSYVQMPLTVDTRAALMYLNTMDPSLIENQGTSIGDALQTALRAFEQGGTMSGKSRAVILITDGETHDEEALEMAEALNKENIRIITIGAGTAKGAPIPVQGRGGTTDYKKDSEGNIVLSKLNEEMLQELARAGNGPYLHVNDGRSVVQQVRRIVNDLDKQEEQSFEYAEYKQHFQVFLIIAILLLLLEWFLSDKGWNRLKQFVDQTPKDHV